MFLGTAISVLLPYNAVLYSLIFVVSRVVILWFFIRCGLWVLSKTPKPKDCESLKGTQASGPLDASCMKTAVHLGKFITGETQVSCRFLSVDHILYTSHALATM